MHKLKGAIIVCTFLPLYTGKSGEILSALKGK